MAAVRFSRREVGDLDEICAFTIRKWDEAQADRYLEELESATLRLLDGRALGRRCDQIRAGLWRLEVASHVVFFRRDGEDIFVCRVLHKQMLAAAAPFDDET